MLFAVVSYALLHTLFPYLYILKAQLSMFILSSFVILSFCLNTLKTLLNFFSLSFYASMSLCLSSCSHQGEEELFINIIWAAWWLWANKIKKDAQIVCRTQNNRYLCSVKKCWWKPSSLHQHSKRIICGLYLCRASHYFLNTKGPTTTKRVDQPQPNERTNHNQTSGPTTTTQTGPSPIPSPVGRGVITEIPLSACCSLFTVLVGLM